MSPSRHRRPLRIPLTVDGGIRAQNLAVRNSRYRNTVRAKWWSRQWLAAIEGFRIGARLGRGRNYAASGQVGELTIEPGLVQAVVQGAVGEPYFCFIRFAVAEGTAKDEITKAIREDAVMYASLLNGYLPEAIEPLFANYGIPLLPSRKNDIWSECSCPDYANPCKHLAAVYYLIGETIAQSPLTLLKLRGIVLSDETGAEDATPAAENAAPPSAAKDFYAFDGTAPRWKSISASGETAPLLLRLGALPLWRGEERFEETLSGVYRRCADRASRFWR